MLKLILQGIYKMKKITYSFSLSDASAVKNDYVKLLKKSYLDYVKNPQNYIKKSLPELFAVWSDNAKIESIFNQFVRDEIASISKFLDDDYSFDDHKGDCYCPITNSDINPKILKEQERKERSRFNRLGVFCHSLSVLGENDIDTCCGFVGNDFIGSGIDIDFYKTALFMVNDKMPDYYNGINQFKFEEHSKGLYVFLTNNYPVDL